MTPLDQAQSALDRACEHFDRVRVSTTPPGVLQQAVRDLMAAVDHFADLRRETVRGS